MTELIAREGYKLTDGNDYYSRVRLAANDSAERYTAIAVEDIPVEDIPVGDIAIPAWDIMQGQAIAIGDIVQCNGVTYRCIQAHTAAWSRQPPCADYWEVIT